MGILIKVNEGDNFATVTRTATGFDVTVTNHATFPPETLRAKECQSLREAIDEISRFLHDEYDGVNGY